MIPESTIEQVLEQFESHAIDYEQAVRDFGGRQPALLSFLIADTEGVLSEDEKDFMLYLAMVIFKSVERENPDVPKVSPDEIAEAEEANWALMDTTKGKPFQQRLDPFFEKSPQEDLLAFVEDSLFAEAEDEDGASFTITKEGQEPMFVALKTVIDVLTMEEG